MEGIPVRDRLGALLGLRDLALARWTVTTSEERRRIELQSELLEVEQCRERMHERLESYRRAGRMSEVEFYRDMVDDLDHRMADIEREVGRHG